MTKRISVDEVVDALDYVETSIDRIECVPEVEAMFNALDSSLRLRTDDRDEGPISSLLKAIRVLVDYSRDIRSSIPADMRNAVGIAERLRILGKPMGMVTIRNEDIHALSMAVISVVDVIRGSCLRTGVDMNGSAYHCGNRNADSEVFCSRACELKFIVEKLSNAYSQLITEASEAEAARTLQSAETRILLDDLAIHRRISVETVEKWLRARSLPLPLVEEFQREFRK